MEILKSLKLSFWCWAGVYLALMVYAAVKLNWLAAVGFIIAFVHYVALGLLLVVNKQLEKAAKDLLEATRASYANYKVLGEATDELRDEYL